jgi:hypothetical protein
MNYLVRWQLEKTSSIYIRTLKKIRSSKKANSKKDQALKYVDIAIIINIRGIKS